MRATYLGAVRAGSLQQAAATQQVTKLVIPAPRGTITDRHGVELAVSESADDVDADPHLINKLKSPRGVAQQRAPLLAKPFTTVLAGVTKPHRVYVRLAHLLPSDQAA